MKTDNAVKTANEKSTEIMEASAPLQYCIECGHKLGTPAEESDELRKFVCPACRKVTTQYLVF